MVNLQTIVLDDNTLHYPMSDEDLSGFDLNTLPLGTCIEVISAQWPPTFLSLNGNYFTIEIEMVFELKNIAVLEQSNKLPQATHDFRKSLAVYGYEDVDFNGNQLCIWWASLIEGPMTHQALSAHLNLIVRGLKAIVAKEYARPAV